MRKRLIKYRFLIFAIVSTLLFSFYYFNLFNSNYQPKIAAFQSKFQELEKNLNAFLKTEKDKIKVNGSYGSWENLKENPKFNLHVYKNDSLIFWNTNQLPIIRFADIHFPSDGVIHLQNGWYYAKMYQEGSFTLCGSFLIKNDFSYENKDLINDFIPELNFPVDASISLEQGTDYPVYSVKKDFLFSIIPNEFQPTSENEARILLVLLLASVILWLFTLFKFLQVIPKFYQWILFVSIVLLRLISLQYEWFGFLHELQPFQASLYGTNKWFPNFFEYLVNCAFITFIIFFLKTQFSTLHLSAKWAKMGWLFFLINIPFWSLFLYLNKGLIENSSIPLIIDRLFSLNIYSVLAIISIGVLLYSYYVYAREIIRFNKRLNNDAVFLTVLSFIFGIFYFLYEMNFGHQLFVAAIFPLVFNGLMIYFIYREGKRFELGFGLTFLALFAFVSAINLAEFNHRKEKSERELYANQLASEQDIVTEVEYSNVVSKIKEDNVIQMFIHAPMNMGLSDFEDGLERRIFNGFWERYEMNFNLFDVKGNSLISGGDNQHAVFEELNEIISKHGQVSEIDSNMYFISDYTGKYSYIIRQPVVGKDSSVAILFCTLKSKKIPEEIGFPRLLISSKAQVFESLENYSIGKYHNGRLVTKYGRFNFPSTVKPIKKWIGTAKGFYDSDGYNHFILEKSKHDLIILSSKNSNWIEYLTSFSYLFSFYGILLLPLLFQFNYTPLFKRSLSLAVKIQLVLVGLVFVSLFAFGWGSGIFVRNQYNEYTYEIIREKLASVETELQSKLGSKTRLAISEDGNYIEYLLQKFSKVFNTDINLYDPHGYMLASSRPKIFNIGLLGEQMNPKAAKAFLNEDKSEFIHDENIGKLKFASAYLPFYNHEGKHLGFLNLQHFGQQKEFEDQIQKFLVAIINVFMLLLAISIVLAIFISSWVTSPLRLLQENFSKIKFGKHNQQISYDKEDEIGALVKDYNQKLEELEFTAQQLAQSERESAWREMAKQVAHEIKNPLTPMKLSIQQLLRVYDPADPNSEKKLQRVANSIIEQIDALTNIANEFSNFAKMPRPDFVALDIIPLLENVIEVFREEESSEIILISKLKNVLVRADKDQMIRVFNNLIKNSIQSIAENRKGKIEIRITRENNKAHIEIEDNGSGITAEQKSKIFVPYFTTKTTGTGLGLAMVKQIVENHNGTIYFETEENKGTIFIIDIPLENS